MRKKGSAAEIEDRRNEGVRLIEEEGFSQRAVALRFGVNERTVREWISLYRRRGKKGLKVNWSKGRPNKLSKKELRRFEKILLRGAKASGFNNELWTSKRIQQIIRQEFSISFHENHIPKVLKQLGWSSQKPTRKAMERDEGRIAAWSKKDWNRIKKKPKKQVLK